MSYDFCLLESCVADCAIFRCVEWEAEIIELRLSGAGRRSCLQAVSQCSVCVSDAVCVLSNGIVSASALGVQRQVSVVCTLVGNAGFSSDMFNGSAANLSRHAKHSK